MKKTQIRCGSCGSVNNVLVDRLRSGPRCGNCSARLEFPSSPVDLSPPRFREEILRHPGVALIDFWSPTCGHCMRLNPLLDQMAMDHAGLIKIARVNVAVEQHLAMQFDIRSVPTLVLFKNGKKINQISGSLQREQMESWISSSTGIYL